MNPEFPHCIGWLTHSDKKTVMRYITFCLVFLGMLHSLQARGIRFWSYEELLKASDVVAILEPISTEPTKDIFPDPPVGRPKTDFVGLATQFKVLATLKGEPQTEAKIIVLHFGYSSDVKHIANGARFAVFVTGPIQYRKQVLKDEKEIGGVTVYTERPVWLAFLQKKDDGRYEPVTPQYDSTDSFRELHRGSFFIPFKEK